MPHTLQERDWNLLLRRIHAGKCTPFLGAGACYGFLPLGGDIAQEWAEEFGYPLEDKSNLVRVAQFVAVVQDAMYPKEEISRRFENVLPPKFTVPNEPHGLLADLPLPVYITTNYDGFMVKALESRNKDPKRELCRWNSRLKDEKSAFDDPNFEPTVANPVVYHLHGYSDLPKSLVLTEDDYLDFLVKISQDPQVLPSRIVQAMADTSLLFLGYGIADWNFRVLFRSLVTYLERSLGRAHISVQLVPGGDEVTDEQKAKAQEYLDQYFGELKIRVYWGTCREFITELRERWEAFNHGE